MAGTKNMKHGYLKVWWIPQIPGKRFEVPVEDLVQARLLLDTLAKYDAFQFENNIKPDYSNVGGLMAFDTNDKEESPDGSWCDYHDNCGRDLDEIPDVELATAIWECA